LDSAIGFKLRMIYGHWWLRLFNAAGKNVGDIGPLAWAETAPAVEQAKRDGLADLERDLGSRGK
jgi:hypothetical protein